MEGWTSRALHLEVLTQLLESSLRPSWMNRSLELSMPRWRLTPTQIQTRQGQRKGLGGFS